MSKEIVIKEGSGIAREYEYLRVSLPCRRGEFPADARLLLLDERGEARPCQSRVLKQWPDGSLKWVLLDFPATVPAQGCLSYLVEEGIETPSAHRVTVTPGEAAWQVSTGPGCFHIDAGVFRPFARVTHQGRDLLGSSACLFSSDGERRIEPALERVELEEAGALHAVLKMTGNLALPLGRSLRFTSRLHFYAGSLAVQIEFTLHNPDPARHPGGLWDLGDPGSVLFKELAFEFCLPAGARRDLTLVAHPGADPLTVPATAGLSLYQESSGGENWASANHRNSEGRVPFQLRGYQGMAGERKLAGLRAAPVLWCGDQREGLSVAMPEFWREFPKSLRGTANGIKISLFPRSFPGLHELQGGERKTHRSLLDFSARADSLAWALAPLEASAAPRHYRESGIFPDLPGEQDLVDLFCTPDQILDKREILDEYGWRNFGELYADHEAVFHRGEVTFVSHYNNQYDFVAGAYRKFFAGGDFRWRDLAADLARHVSDIDLYHTDLDREEYNHGLFWHTDHYTDAGLSSHRSYSREQLQGKPAPQCGGGPGPEHCYTSGLMLHYFQTGNPEFKQAVIALAEWVLRALKGSSTVLGTLKRGIGDFSRWRSGRGEKRLFPRYPLTRGTGNAVNACLDAFEVGGGVNFLKRAEELIRGSLHPDDDIEARQLLQTETAWSYTVLLVSVAKFLSKKRELGEYDDGFGCARSSLLSYAGWMLEHEYPYLEKPQQLEYPNETWAAQDLRKAVVLYLAGCYAGAGARDRFWSKARFFFEVSKEELLRHKTSSLSRPVTLMLQNGWVGGELDQACAGEGITTPGEVTYGSPTPALTLGSVAGRVCVDVARAAGRTSVAREMNWIKTRMAP